MRTVVSAAASRRGRIFYSSLDLSPSPDPVTEESKPSKAPATSFPFRLSSSKNHSKFRVLTIGPSPDLAHLETGLGARILRSSSRQRFESDKVSDFGILGSAVSALSSPLPLPLDTVYVTVIVNPRGNSSVHTTPFAWEDSEYLHRGLGSSKRLVQSGPFLFSS